MLVSGRVTYPRVMTTNKSAFPGISNGFTSACRVLILFEIDWQIPCNCSDTPPSPALSTAPQLYWALRWIDLYLPCRCYHPLDISHMIHQPRVVLLYMISSCHINHRMQLQMDHGVNVQLVQPGGRPIP
eukprot:symbB.v1.2.038361.t1/scaffold5886.1/size22756/2